MNEERWRQIEQIVHAALLRAEAERAAFVARACAGDEGLLREVESLLQQQASGDDLLETPPAAAATLTGRCLGVYQVFECIGVGGMGEVYRGRDTKLGRDVAIKILPSLFSSDPDRLARFEREARVLASFNHPHIGAIYGFQDTDGVRALVLELVHGETLADRIARGPILLNEALTIAQQIADGLEAAHDKGIVHRDLKPANIKLTQEGAVKVLDFGLAKTSPDGALEATQAATATLGGTKEGVILGTAAYMSPEQAKGRNADKRADVWSFGVVFYEMLTGRPAFQGETISDVIAKVIEREPDWTALPASTPPRLRELLRRCARKDLKSRLQAIGDARVQIEELISGATEEPAASVATQPHARIATAAIVLAGLSAMAAWLLASRPVDRETAPPPVSRVSVRTASLAIQERAQSPAIALSPDGSHLVYVVGDGATGHLYARRLDSFEAKPIQGADNAHGPFFSPDGKWVAFFSGAQLKKAPVGGGPPVPLSDLSESGPDGGSWGVDDTIIFAGATGLWRVPGTGGKAELVVRTDGPAYWPEILPNGSTVLFTATGPQIWIHSLKTGQRRVLFERGSHARYVSSGHVVYASDGLLMAAPFDIDRLEVIGPSVPVIERVMMTRPGAPALGHYAVSASGSLAYLSGPVRNSKQTLLWVDHQGREESLNVEPRSYVWPKVSPDGTRVAVEVIVSGNRDVWIYDLVRESWSSLTFGPADDGRPLWTPDGHRVVFRSNRDGGGFNLFWQRVDGAGQAVRLTSEPNGDPTAWAFTPDAKMLVVSQVHPRTGQDLHVMSMEPGYALKPLLQERFFEGTANLSRDGRWLAYRSDETGVLEIYMRPFPNVDDGKWQVTASGGTATAPLWPPGGKQLLYRAGDSMMTVPIETVPTFTRGRPKVLFANSYIANMQNVDVSPDGQRFLIIKDDAPIPTSSEFDEISVVLNWTEELKRLMPGK